MLTAQFQIEYEGRRSLQEAIATINSSTENAHQSHEELLHLHTLSAVAIINDNDGRVRTRASVPTDDAEDLPFIGPPRLLLRHDALKGDRR